MKSMRAQLLAWLLGGVAGLLLVAGSCILITARFILLTEVETELQQARKVVYNLWQQGTLAPGAFVGNSPSHGERLRFRDEERWREFDFEDGELLYQLRGGDGEVLLRSTSLGDRTIERPDSLPQPRHSARTRLADGSRLRLRVDYPNAESRSGSRPPRGSSRDPSLEIIVARDVSEISRTLSLLMAGIWGAGLLAVLATAGFVSFVLRKSLSPLHDLGKEASQIDANSLTTRFQEESMPRELQPICDGLNELMGRLETSFERERRFSSDLAHELRTPIAELSATAEAALRFPHRVSPSQFEDMLASAQEMQGIVESLLALARWEQGSSELNLEPVDLAEMVDECWNSCSAAAEKKNLQVDIQLPSGQQLTTDRGLFRHILKNLFSNAVEYTPAGGNVSIEGSTSPSSTSSGLTVSNTVNGLQPQEVEHLFERFWRRDPSRTGSGHSGLGLSVARACAETLSLGLNASLKDDRLRFDIAPKA